MEKLNYNSSFEGEFVKYYEMYFYHGNQEIVDNTIEYIDSVYDKYCNLKADEGNVIIDIGCGTGIFEEGFAGLFDRVAAVDISNDMIDYAVANHNADNIEYLRHNICDAPIECKADMIVALSHVIGYQLTNDSLDSFISNISNSLKPGGVFAFSFYNGPAILRSELSARENERQIGDVVIKRRSNSTPYPMDNVLVNEYDYLIQDSEEIEITIKERIRYFSRLELEYYLSKNGLRIASVKKYMSDEDLTEKEWNGCIIAVKD